jgi:hypothetical protein
MTTQVFNTSPNNLNLNERALQYEQGLHNPEDLGSALTPADLAEADWRRKAQARDKNCGFLATRWMLPDSDATRQTVETMR